MMTFMSSRTQRLFNFFPTVRAVGTGVVGWNSNRRHSKHLAKIFQPLAESRPRGIRNGFSQLSVSDHVPHHQVLIGNQVVRPDNASCQFHGKIFTLPAYLEVLLAQAISRFGSVFRAFLGSRKTTIKPLESFLGLPKMTGIFNRLPVRVSVEVGQPNIQTDSFTRWFSLLDSLNIKTKLNVVPVTTTDNPDTLNLLQLIKMQITGSPQLETSGFKPIGESDSSSIERQLPATGFVFYRTMCLMLFKARESLLSWFSFFTVVVEPSNRRPSSFVP